MTEKNSLHALFENELRDVYDAEKQIVKALRPYEQAHPKAVIETYRQNSVSVRVRILDSTFQGKSRAQREEEVWAALEQLPADVAAEISLLLLLTPEEAKSSFASLEFDDPIPLVGEQHNRFGFSCWEAQLYFDNLSITPL